MLQPRTVKAGIPMFSGKFPAHVCLVVMLVFGASGCHSTRRAEAPAGPQFRVLTFNVNWGGPGADQAAEIIRKSGADIVCLQETTPEWEQFLRQTLGRDYPFAQFRNSAG